MLAWMKMVNAEDKIVDNAQAEIESYVEFETDKKDKGNILLEEDLLDLEILQPEAGPPQAENPKH